ncbi:MAG: MFS transporter [Chlamydiota bacterium]|nr:MFS transporter [Chlamydiota bacterium]
MGQNNDTKPRRRVLLSVLFTIFLDFFNLGLVYPIFSVACLGEEAFLGNSIPWMSQSVVYALLVAAFPFGQFIGAPVLGQYSDRYGRKPLLSISLIGSVITLGMAGLSMQMYSLGLLLLARFLGGVMAGNMTIAYASLTDLGSNENKVRNFALVPLATGLGFTLGPYMASVFADSSYVSWFDLSTPFYAAAFFSVLNFALVQLFFIETLTKKNTESYFSFYTSISRLSQGVISLDFRIPLLILFLMVSANLSFVQFISLYAVSKFSIDISGLGALYTNIGISVAIGHIFLTRTLASRFSIGQILPKSLALLAITLAIIGLTGSLLTLHCLTFFVMVSCAVAYSNTMAYVSNIASGSEQGKVMGMAVSIQSIAECLPPLVLGWSATYNPVFPLVISSLMAALALRLLRTTFSPGHSLCNPNN